MYLIIGILFSCEKLTVTLQLLMYKRLVLYFLKGDNLLRGTRYIIRGSQYNKCSVICTKNFNSVAFIHVKMDLFVKFAWLYSSISNISPICGLNAYTGIILSGHTDILVDSFCFELMCLILTTALVKACSSRVISFLVHYIHTTKNCHKYCKLTYFCLHC